MKILIPVDGSVYSDNAVAFVASRTTLIGHEPHIVLLNVQAPLPARASRLVSREALDDYYKDESEKAFKPARKILKKAKMAAEEIANGFSRSLRFEGFAFRFRHKRCFGLNQSAAFDVA